MMIKENICNLRSGTCVLHNVTIEILQHLLFGKKVFFHFILFSFLQKYKTKNKCQKSKSVVISRIIR